MKRLPPPERRIGEPFHPGAPVHKRRVLTPLLAALALAVPLAPTAAAARSLNGFELDARHIDPDEIQPGGPPRGGIAALDAPAYGPIAGAPWADDEVVIGVALAGEARAYPISILDWHELVNDALGGRPILVSYCPLCGTGMVFDRSVGTRTLRFGVSGLLYRSDLLMFDHETGSLWSQIHARAETGPSQGQKLSLIRAGMHRLGDWREKHPDSTVLSPRTGHDRPYGRTPYAGYATSEELAFPAPRDDRYHLKMPTLGLRSAGGKARAYPAVELARAGGRVRESFAGASVEITYDPERQVFSVEAPPQLEVIEGFWFAWLAFHPESSVFVAPEEPGQ